VDGAFTQSLAIEAHGVVTIIPPWSALGTLTSTTQNYSLYIIAGPWLLTAFIAVVSKSAARPTQDETNRIWRQVNKSIADYPDWTLVPGGASNFYVSRVDFPQIDPKFNVSSGLSENIQNFRLVGNGLEVKCNTPTWLDQGSVVLAQFATEYTKFTQNVNRYNVLMQIKTGTTRDPAAGFPYTNMPVLADVLFTDVSGDIVTFIPPQSAIKVAGQNSYAGAFNTTTACRILNYDGEYIGDLKVGSPQTIWFDYDQSPDLPNGFNLVLHWGTVNGPVLTKPIAIPTATNGVVGLFNAFLVEVATKEAEDINLWIPPSFNTTAQRQADPLSSAALFKSKGGYYMPTRLDEPVFNVTQTVGQRRVFALGVTEDRSDLQIGTGILDFMDQNFMTQIHSLEGISYANYPFIKMDRYAEVVPLPGSDYSIFCTQAPVKDQLAIDIAREVAIQGPHAYTPDVNSIGGLFTFITTLVSVIPKFMAGAESTAFAVAEAIQYVNSKLGISAK